MATTRLALTLLVSVISANWSQAGGTPNKNKPDSLPRKPIPINHLPVDLRNEILQIIKKPTLSARGPLDSFLCRPEHYHFFLDNPDRAVTAWRRLGAICVDISKVGKDKYAWEDEFGSKVTWEVICRGSGYRVWFARGKVRAARLLPLVPLRIVIVLRHKETESPRGYAVVQQQSEMFLKTNSRAIAAATRMLGQSTTRAAEGGLEQMQLFFSGLSRFLGSHPSAAESLTRAEASRSELTPNELRD